MIDNALPCRYFGGTKLGAGGLMRAYGAAARECLRAAPRVHRQAKSLFRLCLPYKTLGSLYSQMEKLGATRSGVRYFKVMGRLVWKLTANILL